MKEIFRKCPIKPFGVYSISNYGTVRNNRTDTILKYRKDKDGYNRIAFQFNGLRKDIHVHVLVCIIFNGPKPNNKDIPNHKDGNKANNFYKNLQWVTYQENVHHAIANNLIKRPKHEKHWNSKLTEQQVLKIRLLNKHRNLTHYEIAKRFGIARSTISQIISGYKWK